MGCRRSIALRERRLPKMLTELLDPRSLLCGERPGKVWAAARGVVHNRCCGGGIEVESEGSDGMNDMSVSSRRPPAPQERAVERAATLAERGDRAATLAERVDRVERVLL